MKPSKDEIRALAIFLVFALLAGVIAFVVCLRFGADVALVVAVFASAMFAVGALSR